MNNNMLELDADAMAERVNSGEGRDAPLWEDFPQMLENAKRFAEVYNAALKAQSRIAELETQLADALMSAYVAERHRETAEESESVANARLKEAVESAANTEALFKATLNDIREEAEGALGYEQMCDAQTAVHRLTARLKEAEGNKPARVLELQAENERLRAALEKVEAYFASEDGPIYRLWENCDIGDYDDYQTEWEQTLFDVRDWKNGCVPAASVGGGTEWPEVVLYREILAALRPAEAGEGRGPHFHYCQMCARRWECVDSSCERADVFGCGCAEAGEGGEK